MSVPQQERPIKCVVWDLDNTLWQGVLMEGGGSELITPAMDAILALDERGILQSIASRNDHDSALRRLAERGVSNLFLYPQIHWGSKSASLSRLSELLNLGLDSFAFVDDDPFERDEVRHQHPDVLCLHPANLAELLQLPRANPAFITPESKTRREMYQSDVFRTRAREEWSGTEPAFLASLALKFEIRRATQDDLRRAEELTVRTNQLNSTGQTYSHDELEQLLTSKEHAVLVASLTDKYGSYGTIGLCLLEQNALRWRIKLLLMSCRVMSRGVGGVMLAYIMAMAKKAQVKLQADFVPTDKNRMMYVAYKFAGFAELDAQASPLLLQADSLEATRMPDHIEVVGPDLTTEDAK